MYRLHTTNQPISTLFLFANFIKIVMDKITNVRITKCDESLYIRPSRMLYEQDGRPKSWDLMRIHDSVAIIIFNISRQVLIFVKQFRPAVYFAEVKDEDLGETIDTKKYPSSLGMTIELCAGIVDKRESLAEIAREEVLEECGYNIPLSSLEKVSTYRSGVGVTGSHQTLFYTEVTDAMKVSEGGGNVSEGEYIEVIELDLAKAYSLMYDETVARPPSMILALMWFFQHKVPPKVNQKL